MPRRSREQRNIDLKSGLLTGLLTSTFSTLFVVLTGRHVGRDPEQDFMQVAMWNLNERAIDERPQPPEVAAGVASHQFADVFWAVIFFGLVLPLLGERRRRAILASAVPWAVGTAAAEYYVFLPWLQPWLPMQIPFWTVATVHLSSASAYPLFPWLTKLFGGDPDAAERRLGRWTAAALSSVLVVAGALWWWAKRKGDPRWPGVDAGCYDERFLRRMAGHHEVGLRLSHLAGHQAATEELRQLGLLMASQHRVELELMHHWYRSWFDEPLPPLTDEERATMDGMPPEEEVDALSRLDGEAFDRRFLELMVPHHEGAIRMAQRAKDEAKDPRVKLFADGIDHSQRRQIDEMTTHVRGREGALAA